MSVERVTASSGPLAMVGGVLWAVAPAVTLLLERRLINAVYLLPLALVLLGLFGLWRHTEPGVVGLVGYTVVLGGILFSAIGSALASLFSPGTLVAWGVGTGVFYIGFYLLVVGAVFIGGDLLHGGVASRRLELGAGLLVLTLPVAVLGLRAFNALGFAGVNWLPFTLPFGVAWVVVGYGLATSPVGATRQANGG